MRIVVVAALAAMLVTVHGPIVAGAESPDPAKGGGPITDPGSPGERAQTHVYFGDLHLHTAYSFDAFLFKTVGTPDDAYAFAQGKPMKGPNGVVQTIDAPLDFLAVTDHSELLGVIRTSGDPSSPFYDTPIAKAARDPDYATTIGLFKSLLAAAKQSKIATVALDPTIAKPIVADSWAHVIEAANRNYKPGKFTTLIAYEWSSSPETKNLHRNVFFRGSTAPQPFTSLDSLKPEVLWNWLDHLREQGYQAIAIPHNSNMSDGLMFDSVDSDGKPLTKFYAENRRRNEPAVEVTQGKGESETHPFLSPNDEFADFEVVNERVGSGIKITKFQGSYVRDAYRAGLTMQESQGFDPYKFGLVGATDNHNAMTHTRADAYNGAHGAADGTPEARLKCTFCKGANSFDHFGNMGLTAVWSGQNTREDIFDGIVRRETYATTGSRMTVRFFGGWDLKDVKPGEENWLEAAYRRGVPMGSDLPISSRPKPQFVVFAAKDPNRANLDRIQIVKIWSRNGVNEERVFDVAWSGNRKPDANTGKVPAIGNTVDVKNASYTDTIGSAVLAGKWTDPAFDPKAPAAYYVRVLEIPTPRWSTYDAKTTGLPIPDGIPASVQQRAYTSPIWYDVPSQ